MNRPDLISECDFRGCQQCKSTQRVLVPEVYGRVKPGDIDGSGALLLGNSVNLNLNGDLNKAAG